MRKWVIFLFATTLTMCSMETKPLRTAENVELDKYMGKWYDIAHFPATFLNGCENITAKYSMSDKNYVKVFNRCVKVKNGKVKTINGKAFIVDGSNNSKLRVQFFWPIRADYWIIYVDENYEYAAIGGPSRDYAWILARTPDPDEKMVSALTDTLEKNGFDISKLERTVHDE